MSAEATAAYVLDAQREMARLQAENERLRLALEEIVNPLKFMRERAEAEGLQLSGMAYSISESVSHLRDIAKRALSNVT